MEWVCIPYVRLAHLDAKIRCLPESKELLHVLLIWETALDISGPAGLELD